MGIWGPDLKLSRSFRIATDSCKARDLWVTHFVALQNINKIAVAFTSKEIGKKKNVVYTRAVCCKLQSVFYMYNGQVSKIWMKIMQIFH